jgi:uncharacterized protein HemX
MTTFDDHSADHESPQVATEAASAAPTEGGTPPAAPTRPRRTWFYVLSALALIVALGIGYLTGYTTSGASSAKTQRNQARATLAKTQQDLATARAQLATAQNDLATQKARGNACSAYAASLQKTVTTGGTLLQAINDYEASQPGSAAETAASNSADQLYTQVQQEIGASRTLAPACTGSAT